MWVGSSMSPRTIRPDSTRRLHRPMRLGSFLMSGQGWPYLLVPFIPIAVALEAAHGDATLIFFTSALGVIPTAERVHSPSTVEALSFWVSLVLMATFVAGLVFSLRTHRDLFNPVQEED